MSAHTPGPWTVANGKIVGNGYNIASINGSATSEGKANSALIAAAPDLLKSQTMGSSLNTPDFLDWIADRLVGVYGEPECIDFVASLRERSKSGRAAIAKATGQ